MTSCPWFPEAACCDSLPLRNMVLLKACCHCLWLAKGPIHRRHRGCNCAQPGSTLDVSVLSGGVLLKQKIISLVRPAGLQISYSTPSVLCGSFWKHVQKQHGVAYCWEPILDFVCFDFCSTGDQSQGLMHGCTPKEKTDHYIHFKKMEGCVKCKPLGMK